MRFTFRADSSSSLEVIDAVVLFTTLLVSIRCLQRAHMYKKFDGNKARFNEELCDIQLSHKSCHGRRARGIAKEIAPLVDEYHDEHCSIICLVQSTRITMC